MNLKHIKALAEKRRYDDALTICKKLLDEVEGVEDKGDILRTRAVEVD